MGCKRVYGFYMGNSAEVLREGTSDIACVDLFCGAGGLTLGLEAAGIDVRFGIDADPACAYAYRTNTQARFLPVDVRALASKAVAEQLEGAKWTVLAGCAPCQPFSTYTQGRLSERDDRWGLLASFARIAVEVRPHVVTMENVWKLARHGVFDRFVAQLRRAGYSVKWWVLDCVQFGIPQSRRRLVLIASRIGSPSPPTPTTQSPEEWSTVEDTIGHLPKLSAGESDPADPLHVASGLSEVNLRRIRASKPGGTWRDWPEDLRAQCHTRDSGRTYPSVYGRMESAKPAPTITGQCYGFGNGRFGHPDQDRAISLREAALLQTFPLDFQLFPRNEEVSISRAGQMIGNAVPPKLGEAIGKAIITHFGGLGIATILRQKRLQRRAYPVG